MPFSEKDYCVPGEARLQKLPARLRRNRRHRGRWLRDFPFDMSTGGLQTYTAMFDEVTAAAKRFVEAAEANLPTESYVAVFEALNCAVVLDDRTPKTWKPHGELLSWGWRAKIEGAEILRGVPFARNSMHHDWSEVLELTDLDRRYPRSYPSEFQEWIWKEVRNLPRPERVDREAEAIYIDRLAGSLVRSTLVGLNAGFSVLRELLEPRLIRPSVAPSG